MYSSDFDQGINQFSRHGRIYQLEFAVKSSNHGATSIGIQTAQGVVLAAEKKVASKLMIVKRSDKVSQIDEHLGATFSGLMADAKTIIEKLRDDALEHKFEFNEPLTVRAATKSIVDVALSFGKHKDSDEESEEEDEYAMSRPIGVAVLLGGWDKNGASLYCVDPAGITTKYDAKVIGSAHESGQAILEADYYSSISLEDGIKLALTILRREMEQRASGNNIELAMITEEGFIRMSSEEIDNIIKELEDEDVSEEAELRRRLQEQK
ncbi:hypothetical protein PCE1_000140 [Barthelona sp. PCE]